MDRGIPTEETLAQMRGSTPPVRSLVGTPKGRLSTREAALRAQPWQQGRAGIAVKLLPQAGELYGLARSASRVARERAIRRKQLQRLWQRLTQLQGMALTRDPLLLKLGAARQRWPAAWRLVQVEEAFKMLKGDLALSPIHHQLPPRIEAHICVAFLAYALHATLRRRLRDLASGLTSRAVLDKFPAIQMVDVHLPTPDGRELVLARYTQPEPDAALLRRQLRRQLPAQPPPRLYAQTAVADSRM